MGAHYPDKHPGNGKVLTVIGNRPQFIKAAAVSGPLRAVADGQLLTPPLEERILASITRDRMLAETDAREAICTLDDVRGAEEAFIASSVREVMPIAAVDDIELPQAPGPVTSAAHEAFRRRVARELEQPAAAA